MQPVSATSCSIHRSRRPVSVWEPWLRSAPSRSSPGASIASFHQILQEEKVINGIHGFAFFFRNITDVLSCFTDSPPPSPTFPEGGNPVLYGEEDNKVIRNRSLKATDPVSYRTVQPRFLLCLSVVSQSILDEPIHILNVAIKTDSDIGDDSLAATFREFTQSKVVFLLSLIAEIMWRDTRHSNSFPFLLSRNLSFLNMESEG